MNSETKKIPEELSWIDQKEKLLKLVAEEGQGQSNEENIRLRKLVEEGKIETVNQILSHRRAVASAKKQEE